MSLALRVVLVGLVAYRLARAVSLDTITDPLRDWLHRRAYRIIAAPPGRKEPVVIVRSRPWAWVYSLISCAFCASWWIALGASALWFGEWSMDFAVAAVASAGVAALAVTYDVSRNA